MDKHILPSLFNWFHSTISSGVIRLVIYHYHHLILLLSVAILSKKKEVHLTTIQEKRKRVTQINKTKQHDKEIITYNTIQSATLNTTNDINLEELP